MKRIFLLIATNLLIMTMLGVALFVLQAFFGVQLQGWGGYLVIAAVFGFGGAFISLAMSRQIAKWSTRAKVIENPQDETERWLVETVQRHAAKVGLKTPEVAIYDAPEINAFATGPSRNRSLVAVSTGLLRGMAREEAEAVLAHEMSHVANGDMVTMTLIQGTLNTFVMVAARAVGLFADRALGGRGEGGVGAGYFIGAMVGQLVFGLLASALVMAFSRRREFRADAGAASLEGKQKMIAALRRLGQAHGDSTLPASIQAFGIQGGRTGKMAEIFSSHPSIELRIAALEQLAA